MKEYKSEGTNIDFEEGGRFAKVGEKLEESIQDFGAHFEPLPEAESYYPTRLEYFAGKALQGLVTGRAEKDLRHAAVRALQLAKEMEDAVDSAQD